MHDHWQQARTYSDLQAQRGNFTFQISSAHPRGGGGKLPTQMELGA